MKSISHRFNSHLFLSVIFLLVLGIVMVYSASSFKAQEQFSDSHFFLKKHFVKVLLGIILLVIVAKINYKHWLNWSPILLILSLCLLLYLLFSNGITEIRGSKRWIDLGFMNLQPSDFARISLILFLSLSLGAANFVTPKSKRSFIFHLFIIALIVTPILLQPDAGSALLICVIAFTIIFVAGEKLLHLFSLLIIAVPVFLLYLFRDGYQRVRIMKFINSLQGQNVDWQALQSLIAFGNGSILGLGLGGSRQKYHFLPDPFTDFIFSIVGEELGLFGTTLVLIIFVVLVWSGIRIAMQAPDFQGKILGFGLVTSIAVYAFTNMAVVVNLLPTKGIPLPFLSYGGSALLSNLFAVGVLLNIADQSRKEHELRPVGSFYAKRKMPGSYD